MTREIKFRAWDKTKSQMLYNEFMCMSALATLELMLNGGLKDAEIMQYTGLKDKNGKEIYEGDILSYPQEEQTISVRWDKTGANWQFDEHEGFDDGVGRGNWDFKMGIANNSEVIGNIWENPELLKEEQTQ